MDRRDVTQSGPGVDMRVVGDTDWSYSSLAGLALTNQVTVRVAPLLQRVELYGTGFGLVTGRVRVLVPDEVVRGGAYARRISYEVGITGSWHVSPDGVVERIDLKAEEILAAIGDSMRPLLQPSTSTDPTMEAARHAKALCELSRNSVVSIREIRYQLEERLANESADDTADEVHTWIVSSILKLNIVCGRCVDIARELVREGLWSYLDDDDAYHAYRRLRDPSLIVDQPPADIAMRSWMRLHDTAIRHCEQIDAQLTEESSTLVALLEAASSISSSREADAQTRLNTLVALLSLGLGVPALVLVLYGAQLILPLDTVRQQIAFVPNRAFPVGGCNLGAQVRPTGRDPQSMDLCGSFRPDSSCVPGCRRRRRDR